MKIKKRILFLIIGLIFLALSGLILLQLYLLRNAYAQKEQAFKSNVAAAMNKVSFVIETNEAAVKFVETAVQDSILKKAKIPFRTKHFKIAALPQASYGISSDMPEQSLKSFNITRDENGIVKVIVGITDSLPQKYNIKIQDGNQFKNELSSSTYSYIGKTGTCSVATNVYYVSDKNKPHNIELTGLAKENKDKIVNRVVDKLFVTENKPIEKRVHLNEIDSLLNKYFNEAGINIPFGFGVTSGAKDTLAFSVRNNNTTELINSPMKARLFPGDLLSNPSFLVVHFPDSRLMIIKEMLPILVLTFIFILIIGGCFIYSIRTIISQKRFSGHIISFINNMTHEFKTPISTISLASEAIGNPLIAADSAKLARYNEIIKEENSRMRMQVEKILQMAVIEEKDYELDLQVIDLHAVIGKTVKNYSVQIEAAGCSINYILGAHSHFILGDQVHIANIINNIIENAVKYSLESPDISIITENRENDIVVTISDKGIGIKEDDIKRVFDKYYRVSTGNTHDIKGFGLGLSYVKLMVEAHKGSINIKSKHGSGTNVIVTIPVYNIS